MATKKATAKPVKATRSNTIPTSSQSVNNGIKILKQAVKSKISVSTASRDNGKGKNYVYNIFDKIEKNRKEQRITADQHKEFKALYSQATR